MPQEILSTWKKKSFEESIINLWLSHYFPINQLEWQWVSLNECFSVSLSLSIKYRLPIKFCPSSVSIENLSFNLSQQQLSSIHVPMICERHQKRGGHTQHTCTYIYMLYTYTYKYAEHVVTFFFIHFVSIIYNSMNISCVYWDSSWWRVLKVNEQICILGMDGWKWRIAGKVQRIIISCITTSKILLLCPCPCPWLFQWSCSRRKVDPKIVSDRNEMKMNDSKTEEVILMTWKGINFYPSRI